MAEIKIEKKKNNLLNGLIVLLALVLIGWIAYDSIEENYEVEAVVQPTQNIIVVDQPNGIAYQDDQYPYDKKTSQQLTGDQSDFDNNYALFVKRIESPNLEMNLEHEYCNAALKALAGSLSALIAEYNIEDEASLLDNPNKIKKYADEITENWRETDHADMIRNAAMSSIEVISTIQEHKFPELKSEVESLHTAALQIKPSTLTLEQKKAVKSFFDQTASVLQKMRSL
jgi:hypothetical protein